MIGSWVLLGVCRTFALWMFDSLILDMITGVCALVLPSLLSSLNQWHLNCDQNSEKVGQKCLAGLPVSPGGGGL